MKDDLENVKRPGTTIMRGKKSLQTYKPVKAYLTERAIAFSDVLEKSNSGCLILFLGQII